MTFYRMTMSSLLALAAVAFGASPAPCQAQETETAPSTFEEWVEFYDARYGLEDQFDKGTDNRGEGLEALYGTRNFRTILKGVAYRGGANNSWHRTSPRDNMNPLPDDGLQNLCEEGFGRSYYLYRTNFEDAPQQMSCASPRSDDHAIHYFQVSPNDEQQSYVVLEAIYETIQDYRHGPVYVHCWNGWHASGLMAAKILRQFCGFTPEEAVAYWDRNTDGNNGEPKYESIRRRIREFEPYPELAITEREARLICPDPQAP